VTKRFPLFDSACRSVIAGEFERAADDFHEFGAVSLVEFGRKGRLESPSPLDHPGLIGQIARFLSLYPGSSWGRVFEAFVRRAQLDYEGSIKAMQRAVASDPRSPLLWALLGRLRFVHRYPARGVSDLERAAGLAPGCGWMQSWLGEALRHRGDLIAALKSLNRGILLDPWYAPAYTWRSAVWGSVGRPERCRADLDEAIRRNPRDAWALHQRMRLLRRQGDYAGALTDARRAHRLNQKFGWIYGRPGPESVAAALRESEGVLERRPGWSWLRAWTGWTRLTGGDAEGAGRDLERACRSLRHPWPMAWLGRAHHCRGRHKEAILALDASLAVGPDYAQAHGWRGEALFHVGNFAQAENSLSHALKLDNVCAGAYYWRAKTRAVRGRVHLARSDVAAALKLMPDYSEARELSAALARAER
jgi:tetratricopeptide (TPR) repeat protein